MATKRKSKSRRKYSKTRSKARKTVRRARRAAGKSLRKSARKSARRAMRNAKGRFVSRGGSERRSKSSGRFAKGHFGLAAVQGGYITRGASRKRGGGRKKFGEKLFRSFNARRALSAGEAKKLVSLGYSMARRGAEPRRKHSKSKRRHSREVSRFSRSFSRPIGREIALRRSFAGRGIGRPGFGRLGELAGVHGLVGSREISLSEAAKRGLTLAAWTAGGYYATLALANITAHYAGGVTSTAGKWSRVAVAGIAGIGAWFVTNKSKAMENHRWPLLTGAGLVFINSILNVILPSAETVQYSTNPVIRAAQMAVYGLDGMNPEQALAGLGYCSYGCRAGGPTVQADTTCATCTPGGVAGTDGQPALAGTDGQGQGQDGLGYCSYGCRAGGATVQADTTCATCTPGGANTNVVVAAVKTPLMGDNFRKYATPAMKEVLAGIVGRVEGGATN